MRVDRDGFWDKLAARCLISPELLKRTVYLHAYGGAVDPWMWSVIHEEMLAMGFNVFRNRPVRTYERPSH